MRSTWCIAERPDVVVLVSSDSDFAPLVIRLREKGCRVCGIGQQGKTGDETRRRLRRASSTCSIHGRRGARPARAHRLAPAASAAPGRRAAAPRQRGAGTPPSTPRRRRPRAQPRGRRRATTAAPRRRRRGRRSRAAVAEAAGSSSTPCPSCAAARGRAQRHGRRPLRAAGLLGKSASSPKLFKKLPDAVRRAARTRTASAGSAAAQRALSAARADRLDRGRGWRPIALPAAMARRRSRRDARRGDSVDRRAGAAPAGIDRPARARCASCRRRSCRAGEAYEAFIFATGAACPRATTCTTSSTAWSGCTSRRPSAGSTNCRRPRSRAAASAPRAARCATRSRCSTRTARCSMRRPRCGTRCSRATGSGCSSPSARSGARRGCWCSAMRCSKSSTRRASRSPPMCCCAPGCGASIAIDDDAHRRGARSGASARPSPSCRCRCWACRAGGRGIADPASMMTRTSSGLARLPRRQPHAAAMPAGGVAPA